MKRKRRHLKKQYQLLLILLLGLLLITVYRHTAESVKSDTTTNSATASQSSTASKDAASQNSIAKTTPQYTTSLKLNLQLKSAWKTILKNTDSHVEIALYDKNTKQTYHYANVSADTTIKTASIIKVTVLAELLKQNAKGTIALNESDTNYAEKMITQSDNDATTYLLNNRLGGEQSLQNVFKTLKMTNSKVDTDAWGYSTTTAQDQLKLLNALFYNTNDYLPAKSRTYAKQLLANVESDQDWGISAGATTYQLKNGWVNDDDGSWIVNSIGHASATTDTNADYTIAILTDNNRDEDSGISLVEQLAKKTNEILND